VCAQTDLRENIDVLSKEWGFSKEKAWRFHIQAFFRFGDP